MFKKFFKVSFVCAAISLFGLIICSYLLLYKVNVSFFDVRLIGKWCIYGISIFVPVAIVSAIIHIYFVPMKSMEDVIEKGRYSSNNNGLHIVR